MRKLLYRTSHVAAWLVLALAGIAFALERTGWIADSLRGRVTRMLPGLDVQLADARVLWFRPGLVLEGLTLRRDDGFLTFDSVEVRLGLGGAGGFLREVEIDGGRARVSDALLDGLRDAGEALSGRSDEPAGEPSAVELPTVSVTDYRVDLVLPDKNVLPIGRADLLVAGDGGNTRVTGRLLPDLAGGTPEAALHMSGRVLEDGRVRVEATARELPIHSDRLPPALLDLPDGFERASASLSVAVEGELDLAAIDTPKLVARLGLDQGVIELDGHAVSGVATRVDVTWAPTREHGLWSPRSWDGALRLDGTWKGPADGAEVRLAARLGRRAIDGGLDAWLHLPRLGIDRDELLGLGLEGFPSRLVEALSPSGSVEATIAARVGAVRVAENGGPPALPPLDVMLDVRPHEDAVVRYAGFRGSSGELWGIPVPASDVSGRVVFGFEREHAPSGRLGLVELRGSAADGTARFDGVVEGPPPGSPPDAEALFDMDLFVPEVALGEELRAGFDGMPATRDIWANYGPEGVGRASGHWRFHSSPATDGFTAQGDVDFEVESMRWHALPVPLEDVRGRLALRWSNDSLVIGGETPEIWRAYGLLVEASGTLPTGGTASVDVRYRTETPVVAPDEATIAPERVPDGGSSSYLVTVDDMNTRGSEFDTLAEVIPVVGELSTALGLKGRADVVYRGTSHGPNDPFRMDLEITPAQVELHPERFPLPFREVEGRALVTGEQRGLDGDSEMDFAVRGTIATRAAAGFTVVADPRVTGDRLDLRLYAAGVDPENRSILGAFESSLGIGGDLDPGRVALRGTLDAAVALELVTGSDQPPRIEAETNLRGNSLVAGNLRLDDMHGTMRLEDRVLYGEEVRARLARTGVELSDFVLAGVDALDRLVDPDPMLSEPGFLTAEEGVVIQGRLHAQNLPLDDEHLGPFLDADTLEAVLDRAGLRGRIDLDGTRLVVVPDGKGNVKLGLHGPIVPHNTFVRAGLPMNLLSCRIDVDSLVIGPSGTRAWGHVSDLFARIAGRRLERASMLVSLVESRMTFENLTGDLAGGDVSGLGGAGSSALSIDLVEPYGFTAALRMSNVDANELLRGLFETSISDKGRVEARLRVTGEPDDLLALRGEASVALSDARLWSIPVLRVLFGQLGFDGTGTFDQMNTGLRLEDGVLYMDNIDARSPLLHLVGEGSVSLDGQLHHDLEVQYSFAENLGPIRMLLYWIQNSILRVAVRGTMWRPQIVLRNALKDFFGGAPTSDRSLPLPALSAIPSRF